MKFLGIGLAACLGICAGAAQAQTLIYTEQGVGSGSLGGSSFTNAAVTISFVGNAANVTGGGTFFNSIGPGTVTVSGLGTVPFTDQLQVFSNQTNAIAGISDATLGGLDILDTGNSAFSTYALTTAIGPITGPSLFNSGSSFATTSGSFSLNSVGSSTFTASVVLTQTPEPGNIGMLFGIGASVSLVALRRRRHKK